MAKITYTQAEEMRRLYHTSRKYTTTDLGKKFGISQPQASFILSAKENPIIPKAEEREKFGIVWKKPKEYRVRVVRGSQTYYLLHDGRIWHLQRQAFITHVEINPPPKREVKRKRYDTEDGTYYIYEDGKIWSCNKEAFLKPKGTAVKKGVVIRTPRSASTPPSYPGVKLLKYTVGRANYYVYDDGRIWSCNRERFLRLSETKGAGLYAPGKQRMGRLMLTLFVRPPKEGEVARHLDGGELNNRISNLAWGTRQDNVNDQVVTGSAKRGKRASNARITEQEAQGLLDEWYATSFDYAAKNEYAKAQS